MKKAIQFGFGVALGVYMFRVCKAFMDNITERCFRKKFNNDPEFRICVKKVSPDLYTKYSKSE